MSFSIFDVVGIIGVVLIVAAYLLLQTGRLESRRPLYSVLNAVGSGMIIVSLWFDFNLSAFAVEFFWLLISLYGIVKWRPGR